MAPQSDQPKAVCLLSGGLDSSVTLAEAHAAGFETYAISVDYGQRHEVELAAAARVAEALGAKEHRVVKVDLSAIGGSALTDDIATKCPAFCARKISIAASLWAMAAMKLVSAVCRLAAKCPRPGSASIQH